MFNVEQNGRVREKSPSFPGRKITVNDWVRKDEKVGKVVDIGQKLKGGELWVKWSGYSIPINEQTVNLQLLGYQGEDLAGTSFNEGYCKRLVSEDYAVMAEVYLEHKREPQIWSLEQLTNKLNGEKQQPRFNQPIKLSLSLIRRDGGTQPRAAINDATVNEYVEDMKNGANFPAVTVFYDGEIYWLADGFHRVEASIKAGFNEINTLVKQGTRRDAVLYSVGANAKHGLRRSNADKRRAVTTLLEDEEWNQWSDRHIARQCGVSHDFVNRLRKSLSFNDSEKNDTKNNDSQTRTYTTKHGTTTTMNTTNIGKSKQTESPPADDVIPDSEYRQGMPCIYNNDIEVTNVEKNTPTNEAVDTPKTDEVNNHDDTAVDNEETEDSNPKQSQSQRKGKQRLVNPLSIGDKVKVKDNHYFGGQEGIVTQLASLHTVIVAFDNDERDVIKLTDLDLPTELSKPILINESISKPVKKEILIKEGLNYKVGNPGYGCKWYIEVEEDDYKLFQQLQKQNNAPSIRSYLVRLVEEKKEPELPPKSDDILVNLSSKINNLNQKQKFFLVEKVIESDSEIVTKLRQIIT